MGLTRSVRRAATGLAAAGLIAGMVLILTGVLSPLGLPGVDMANFAGYILWSLWLIAFAVVLVRRPRTTPGDRALAGTRAASR